MRLPNKRGDLGDNISFIAFLFLMIVIGVGVVVGVGIFYGQGYDSREVEAGILNYKIRECINNDNIENEFFENFFERCRLNKEVIEEFDLIKICRGEGECVGKDNSNLDVLLFLGSNFQSCLFEGVKGNEAYPRCVIVNFYKEGERYEIITGSRQFSRGHSE